MPVITLPGLASMVPPARAAVNNMLSGTPRVQDAVLVASELATNSVRHSVAREPGGTFELTVDVEPGRVRIEVADGGPAQRMPVEDADEHGRGLEIVAELADKWGHDKAPGRSAHWAVLTWDVDSSNEPEGDS